MACRIVIRLFFLLFSMHYDWTKGFPLTDNEHTDLLNYIVYELPLQLDKSELLDDPYVRIEKAPEPIVRVREGESVTLECEAIGIPPPLIYWRKDGKRVKQAERDDETNVFEKLTNIGSRTVESSTTAGRLRLECVEPSMSGLYECVAENGYGRTSNLTRLQVLPRSNDIPTNDQCDQVISESSGLVMVPPTIVMYTQFRLENEGNNAQLFCRANGYPKPLITWLDSNSEPIQMDENQYVLPNGDLFLKNIQGYAQYYCVASNTAGIDRTDSFLYATAR